LDFIIGGNYNKDSMALNSQSLGETTSSAFPLGLFDSLPIIVFISPLYVFFFPIFF
jgi:hypothetical protein